MSKAEFYLWFEATLRCCLCATAAPTHWGQHYFNLYHSQKWLAQAIFSCPLGIQNDKYLEWQYLEIWNYNNWWCPELSFTFGLKLLSAAAWAPHPHNWANDFLKFEISYLLILKTLHLLSVFMGSTILVGSVDSLVEFCYIGLPSIWIQLIPGWTFCGQFFNVCKQ